MTEERKQSLFLEYIDGTLDAEGMEELHALTEEDPSAKEELFSLKELADAAMKGDGRSADGSHGQDADRHPGSTSFPEPSSFAVREMIQ